MLRLVRERLHSESGLRSGTNEDLSAYDAARYGALSGYVDDLLDVIHTPDLRDVIVVGHSVSSMVAILAAKREPDRFSRLILIGPSPRYINEAPDYVGHSARKSAPRPRSTSWLRSTT